MSTNFSIVLHAPRSTRGADLARVPGSTGKWLCTSGHFLDLGPSTTTILVERFRDATLRTEGNPDGMASGTVHQDLKMLAAARRWWSREVLAQVPDVDLPRVRVTATGARRRTQMCWP